MKHTLVVLLVLVFAAPAAADAPRAVTGSPAVLAPLVVDGTGTVNDGGRLATWWFEYVAPWSPDNPFTTPPQLIPASLDDQPVNISLGTIASGTTYRYRLVLQLSDGYVYGDWVEFTTPEGIPKAPPPRLQLRLSSTRLHIARDHTLPVRVGCNPFGTPCRGTLVVLASDAAGAPSLTIPKRFEIASGRRAIVRVRLARAGMRLVGRRDLQVFTAIRDFLGPGSRTGGFLPLSLR